MQAVARGRSSQLCSRGREFASPGPDLRDGEIGPPKPRRQNRTGARLTWRRRERLGAPGTLGILQRRVVEIGPPPGRQAIAPPAPVACSGHVSVSRTVLPIGRGRCGLWHLLPFFPLHQKAVRTQGWKAGIRHGSHSSVRHIPVAAVPNRDEIISTYRSRLGRVTQSDHESHCGGSSGACNALLPHSTCACTGGSPRRPRQE